MNKKGIKTTIIGIIAILGLCYNAYLNGGFTVQDFLMLIFAIGFLAAKDANKSHSFGDPVPDIPPPPDEEPPPGG